jgi:hypothetical protein
LRFPRFWWQACISEGTTEREILALLIQGKLFLQVTQAAFASSSNETAPQLVALFTSYDTSTNKTTLSSCLPGKNASLAAAWGMPVKLSTKDRTTGEPYLAVHITRLLFLSVCLLRKAYFFGSFFGSF